MKSATTATQAAITKEKSVTPPVLGALINEKVKSAFNKREKEIDTARNKKLGLEKKLEHNKRQLNKIKKGKGQGAHRNQVATSGSKHTGLKVNKLEQDQRLISSPSLQRQLTWKNQPKKAYARNQSWQKINKSHTTHQNFPEEPEELEETQPQQEHDFNQRLNMGRGRGRGRGKKWRQQTSQLRGKQTPSIPPQPQPQQQYPFQQKYGQSQPHPQQNPYNQYPHPNPHPHHQPHHPFPPSPYQGNQTNCMPPRNNTQYPNAFQNGW